MTLVLAFVDGLGHDMLDGLPFLATLDPQPLASELGYSVTAHASMYTGVAPRDHGFWFLWQRAPERSPFRWLRAAGLHERLPDRPAVRVAVHRTTRLATARNTSFFGLGCPIRTPLPLWPELAPSEDRLWPEPGYSLQWPTWFDRLREAGRRVRVTAIEPGRAERASELIAALPADPGLDVDYLFFGDVDPRCHRHGKDAPATRERIALVDRTLEEHVRKYERRGHRVRVLAWSDHGHHPVARRVPVLDLLRAGGVDLRRVLHHIDSNYARFWPRDAAEEQRLRRALAGVAGGWFLGPDELARYGVDFADARYGSLIFYLDEGAVFDAPVRALGREFRSSDVSAHGYLPEREAARGFVAGGLPAKGAHIRDVAPTVLALAGEPVPSGLAGRPLGVP